MSRQNNTLEAVANQVAKRDLEKLCRHGMEQNSHSIYEYRANQYERRLKQSDPQYGFLYGWLPMVASDQRDTAICAGGFFQGKNCFEIIKLCLTEDALAVLVKQSCNQYQFWQNILILVGDRFASNPVPALPFTVDYVVDRLMRDRWDYRSESIAGLKNLIGLRGDSFDPNQLDAAQAVDLLRDGVLMLAPVESNLYGKAERLVLNPAWTAMLVADAAADSSDAHV